MIAFKENTPMVTAKDTASNISALRSRRFELAQAALKKIVNTLIKKYRVRKIILIGSLVDRDRFGFQSDIDLCVEGLPDNVYFEAVGELLLISDIFDIDIIPFENLSSDKGETIRKGKVLYEKR
jgi:predicted nucleotidyltransferase